MATKSKICSVKICDRVAECKGLCGGHYSRLYAKGDVQADKPLTVYRKYAFGQVCVDKDLSPCSTTDSQLSVNRCSKHYQERLRRIQIEDHLASGQPIPKRTEIPNDLFIQSIENLSNERLLSDLKRIIFSRSSTIDDKVVEKFNFQIKSLSDEILSRMI